MTNLMTNPEALLARPANVCARLALSFLSAALLMIAVPPAHAEIGLLGHGPLVVGGWIEEEDATDTDQELNWAMVGWGWRLEGPDALDRFFGKASIDFSWKIEALGGAILGDRESVEASVVPLFVLAPASAERWIPYVEGGVGLAYTDLRGFDLGSRIQFSDNIGFGIAHNTDGGSRCSVAYRFRHISHAGLWAESNDGLNSHFLVFSFER
ncbi:MAG: hypothetical protein ACI91F_002567 [Candidatus Binatia bacterium]|jgi:hypothetical protein